MDDFIWRALLGGVGVAVIAGPLGCFIVWRRMAYFGDTLAHSALLGIALGFLLNLDLTFSTVSVCIAIALLLAFLQKQKRLASDTLLGILSHTALSLGLVAIASLEGLRVDLYSYLFGDLLSVNNTDLLWIYLGGGVVLAVLIYLWQPLLSLTVHEELAQIEGVPVVRIRLLFMLLIAIVSAIAMKIIGVLLITSLLIIPAATARFLAHTPEQMAWFASGMGCLAVSIGLGLSSYADTPAGPSVVIAASALFVVIVCLPKQTE